MLAAINHRLEIPVKKYFILILNIGFQLHLTEANNADMSHES